MQPGNSAPTTSLKAASPLLCLLNYDDDDYYIINFLLNYDDDDDDVYDHESCFFSSLPFRR